MKPLSRHLPWVSLPLCLLLTGCLQTTLPATYPPPTSAVYETTFPSQRLPSQETVSPAEPSETSMETISSTEASTSLPETIPSTEVTTSPPETMPSTEASTSLPETISSTEVTTSSPEAIPSTETSTSPPETISSTEVTTSSPEAIPSTEASTSPPETIPSTEASAPPSETTPPLIPENLSARELALTAFSLQNQYLAQHQVPALQWSDVLYDIACARVQEIFIQYNHDGCPSWVAENLLRGTISPAIAIQVWSDSEYHRRNMLAGWTYGAIAQEGTHWVAIFSMTETP